MVLHRYLTALEGAKECVSGRRVERGYDMVSVGLGLGIESEHMGYIYICISVSGPSVPGV